jgi:hypothetical protein
MADVQALFGEIRRAVKGCPEPTMQDALARAARTFCAETWVLRRSQALTTVAGQQQYALQPPANEEVLAVKHAQIQNLAPGQAVVPLRFVYPTLVNPNAGPQRPWGICFVPYQQVALVPVPDNAYPVLLELVTQPAAGTAQVPDELAQRYDRALGHGALEWILRMQGDPWYNPAAADEYRVLFNQEIVQARGTAAFDFTPGQRKLVSGGFAGWRR